MNHFFPGIHIYRWALIPKGYGICIPPLGIFVNKHASFNLVRHEYGHFLQYQDIGWVQFYCKIGFPSIISATFFSKTHHLKPYEMDADKRGIAFIIHLKDQDI